LASIQWRNRRTSKAILEEFKLAKGQKTAKGARPKAAAPKKQAKSGKRAAQPERPRATAPRAESKGAKILDLIGRAKGATLTEIMKVAKWQAHSVRGFLSTAAKKHGLKIESAKNEAGERAQVIGSGMSFRPSRIPWRINEG
jgi:hypothetical protein